MIRGLLLAVGAVIAPVAVVDVLVRRASRRLLAGPRTLPEEASLGPALEALSGEVVRIRARDGLRLSGRWLTAEGHDASWRPDPREAILLLHGWSGSIVPHLVEHGPYLRRTAGVLGLDFRGHGDSEDSPTTFDLREVEDVAGALAWLGGADAAVDRPRRGPPAGPSARSRGVRIAHHERPSCRVPPWA